jgi:glycosyltransferase involved in cell wall biosynthesis
MMRVLHLPTTVGAPSGLSQHLRLLGIDSHVWTISQNYLDYPVDRVLIDERDGRAIRFLKILRAGSYVFGRWDVIHFNYGSTLFSALHSNSRRKGIARFLTPVVNGLAAVLQRWELAILRARRIPIFVHYQGDDARQGDYSLQHFEISIATQVPDGYYTPESDAWKRRQIALLGKRAAGIYAVNPDLMNVLPSSAVFLPYGHVAIQDWEPNYTQADHERLVFAHAPTNREVKGTDLILDALAELAKEGHRFDIDLIEGVSNAEAIARSREADIVIDQLYAGWYGGVALEAMALGKPVVVYLRESDFRFLPDEMVRDLPFFRTSPATIKDDLTRLLEMPRDELVERAKQSRAYTELWHDPLAITSRIADDYRRALKSTKRKSGAR